MLGEAVDVATPEKKLPCCNLPQPGRPRMHSILVTHACPQISQPISEPYLTLSPSRHRGTLSMSNVLPSLLGSDREQRPSTVS
jgi:hypothetical protein